MGWPWPKHDCPNAPNDLKGASLRRPTLFMARMPIEMTKWFQGVLEKLEVEGKGSIYADGKRIPQAVLDGRYDKQRPTLEFLRYLSESNKLRRGLFIPFSCASCTGDVWAYVPTSGDPYIMETRADGTLRHHHCGNRGSTKKDIVRACLPTTMSWREVEVKLRSGKRGRIAGQDETVIGFTSDKNSNYLKIKTHLDEVIQVPSSIKHPIYTFVVAMPDPFNKGKFVIRAPTIEQFMHGLPSSLPKIIPEENLEASRSPVETKETINKQAGRASGPVKSMADACPQYPSVFDRPEVIDFLKTVSVDTLSRSDQLAWKILAARYGWHLGGLVPLGLAQQFASVLQEAERHPKHRERFLPQLKQIGRKIALIARRQLR
ncbi:hypothetical protein Ddep01_03027 [Deinococcus depolymerans]